MITFLVRGVNKDWIVQSAKSIFFSFSILMVPTKEIARIGVFLKKCWNFDSDKRTRELFSLEHLTHQINRRYWQFFGTPPRLSQLFFKILFDQENLPEKLGTTQLIIFGRIRFLFSSGGCGKTTASRKMKTSVNRNPKFPQSPVF